jgi:hypothetical protein
VEGQRLPAYQDRAAGNLLPSWPRCQACTKYHPIGSCPLKVAGAEKCPLCGVAHYGYARVCPHIKSETMVRMMLDTLKNSSEPRYLVDAATKYLRGVKGHLVHAKKKARDALLEKAAGTNVTHGQFGSSLTTNEHDKGKQRMYATGAASTTRPHAAIPVRDPSPDEDVEDRLLTAFQNVG